MNKLYTLYTNKQFQYLMENYLTHFQYTIVEKGEAPTVEESASKDII